jgi:hypothetical protein
MRSLGLDCAYRVPLNVTDLVEATAFAQPVVGADNSLSHPKVGEALSRNGHSYDWPAARRLRRPQCEVDRHDGKRFDRFAVILPRQKVQAHGITHGGAIELFIS